MIKISCISILISIHTPTKGATPKIRRITSAGLFQSTLPQRERHGCYFWTGQNKTDFNPHSHKGSDNGATGKVPIYCDFNPHSHKGSDAWTRNQSIERYYFNPHSHKGSDKEALSATDKHTDFNPHSHKGSDNCMITDLSWKQNFNPHSHKGSDMGMPSINIIFRISIHTPTKGATITTTL